MDARDKARETLTKLATPGHGRNEHWLTDEFKASFESSGYHVRRLTDKYLGGRPDLEVFHKPGLLPLQIELKWMGKKPGARFDPIKLLSSLQRDEMNCLLTMKQPYYILVGYAPGDEADLFHILPLHAGGSASAFLAGTYARRGKEDWHITMDSSSAALP